jgi:5-hydroxyisourate hydrolase-like protein (transthyretin family)
MKENKNNIRIYFLLILAGFFAMSFNAYAQKKEGTRVRAYYDKLPNNNKQIKVSLTTGRGKNMVGVVNADIKLTSLAGEEKLQLATIQTNVDGEAFLQIEEGYPLPKDEEGYAIITAAFAGNDSLKAAKKKLEFLDLLLTAEFNIEDSVKVITLSAVVDSLGTKIPVEELDVEIGVKRMHSTLFLDEVETDEEGKAEFEFPDDIPGDQDGNITIVFRVLEDDDYGTVQARSIINWGTIVDYTSKDHLRSLFGDEAPLWMIIAVLVVLVAAWYHFIWAIIKVYKIKKLGEAS